MPVNQVRSVFDVLGLKEEISNDSSSEESSDDDVIAYIVSNRNAQKNNHTSSSIDRSKSIKNKNRRSVANVAWRSISADTLRLHPLYQPLPELIDVVYRTLDDISKYRQGSEQWDIFHVGRLTTSRAGACLGFYEAKASRYLSIPQSLCGHRKAIHAYQYLQQEPFDDYTSLNSMHDRSTGERIDDVTSLTSSIGKLNVATRGGIVPSYNNPWKKCNSKSKVCKYAPGAPYRYFPKEGSPSYKFYNNPLKARMAWGSYQEEIGILCAINYFCKLNATVSEIGMLAFERLHPHEWGFDSTQTELLQEWMEDVFPLIGASPDGLITYVNGTIEVLEVKNISPFAHDSTMSSIILNDKNPTALATWFLPQIMLHMLCAGHHCNSAILISVTAMHGAKMYRINRDNEYIIEMLYFIKEFYQSYVKSNNSKNSNKLPQSFQPNFFYDIMNNNGSTISSSNSNSNRRYIQFLDRTIAIARDAELVENIDHNDIQRSPAGDNLLVMV